MSIYDDIDADVLKNYQEYSLANIIYYSLKESTTSEQSARMTAMDNASKNACKHTVVSWQSSVAESSVKTLASETLAFSR